MSYAWVLLAAVFNWMWTAEFFGHRVIEDMIFAVILVATVQVLHKLLDGVDDLPFRFLR